MTEALEGMHGGLPNVRDHDLSIYLKAQGSAMALGGYEVHSQMPRSSVASTATIRREERQDHTRIVRRFRRELMDVCHW